MDKSFLTLERDAGLSAMTRTRARTMAEAVGKESLHLIVVTADITFGIRYIQGKMVGATGLEPVTASL